MEVYPRTGGGNQPLPILINIASGLSPHGRGKLGYAAPSPLRAGSIPARAGETKSVIHDNRRIVVYPRTGGGNPSPLCPGQATRGLSPHGRGKPGQWKRRKGRPRSIPARAGETPAVPAATPPATVYPRPGGGNQVKGVFVVAGPGLSPHGRGKRYPPAGFPDGAGSIPARAGETTHFGSAGFLAVGLSPHGRGKRIQAGSGANGLRSIPARAGETQEER